MKSKFATLMKKAFQHIIPLLLLLISNSSLFAHTLTAKHQLANSLEKFAIEKSHQNHLEHLFDSRSSISDARFETYHKKEILSSDNEEEDSENKISKKNSEKPSCHVSFYKQQAAADFTSYTKKTQAFCKELSYLPSRNSLYIIFEVFLI